MLDKLRKRFSTEGVIHEAGTSILEVSNLSASYEGRPALEHISFRLREGERVAVVGPNGAGKSTLFKIIAGVQDADAGSVRIFGHVPAGHICIAYVPQRSQVDWQFPVTVRDVVMMGRIGKIGLFRWPRKSDIERVNESLELVEMSGYAGRQIEQLSGGQQQRVFIAQALAQEADLVLMDEPLAGLDAPAVEAIFRILDRLQERAVNILVATHDLHLAGQRFDRVMLLNRRLLQFGTPEEVITPEFLVDAYGEQVHVLHTDDGRIVMIEDNCHEENAQEVRKIG
jgi:manganese/iron transport system ATP-binding protein